MIRLYALFSFALWSLTAPALVEAATPAPSVALFYCPATLNGRSSTQLSSAVPTGGAVEITVVATALNLQSADTSGPPSCTYVHGDWSPIRIRFQVLENLVGKCTQNKDSQGGITITCGT